MVCDCFILSISIAKRVPESAMGSREGSRTCRLIKLAPTPVGVPKSEQRVQLDEAMKVRKRIIPGQKKQVLRFFDEMGDRFDRLASQNPRDQVLETCTHGVVVAGVRAAVQKRSVIEQSEVDEAGQMDGVHTPWLRFPHRSISEEAGRIAAPGCSSPSDAL